MRLNNHAVELDLPTTDIRGGGVSVISAVVIRVKITLNRNDIAVSLGVVVRLDAVSILVIGRK
jgi:hypothetical protein